MNAWSRFAPWLTVALAGGYVMVEMTPPQDPPGQMRLYEFSKLPVVDGGRVKPIDTLARNTLLIISNRQTFVDAKDNSLPAIRWLADTIISNPKLFESGPSEKYKVFRIENDQVLNLLGLEARPRFWRYSIAELQPGFAKLEKEAIRVSKIDQKQRDLFDQKIIELHQHLGKYLEIATWQVPLTVPSESAAGQWKSLIKALSQGQTQGIPDPAKDSWLSMIIAYAKANPDEFNKELAAYRKTLDKTMPDETSRADFETFFNHAEPFYHCSVLYVLVFILGCAGWIVAPTALNRSAFWLALLTLLVQTWALGARMYLQGRPPVTNLYSSAVFIGWGCVFVCLILEGIYRNGIGNVVAAVTGSLTMLIAHHLAGSGDTLEMMQAVLDTNFWLATHVTCVNIGYTATFVAGKLAILYVFLGIFTRRLDRPLAKSLGQMIYGVICFAMLFSFVGTVLGGIWADQSWGRFWGWDPKENGALMIVVWNALILHARWAGIVKQRGVALLAIVGNMVTGWSWFGTNQLGVGLHAYGFNNTLAFGLVIYWLSQLAIVALGSIPLRYWRSFAGPVVAPPADKMLEPG